MQTFIGTQTSGGGYVTNPTNLQRAPDGNFAGFRCLSVGQTTNAYRRLTSNTAHGTVYVKTKLGPTGAGKTGNYVMAGAVLRELEVLQAGIILDILK